MAQLEDAQSHLSALIQKMEQQGEVVTEEFALDMGHIYAHLNRAWNSRQCLDEIDEANWNKHSAFPQDLEPV